MIRPLRRTLCWTWSGVLVGLLFAFGLPQPAAADGAPLSADLAAALRERLAAGVLRWGGDAEGGAPYQVRSPDDPARVIGFEVDLLDLLASELSLLAGQEIRPLFVQYDWVSLVPGLKKGDFDVIASGFEVLPERQAEAAFTRPYYIYAQQLVVRADETQIQNLPQCVGRRVGTLSGSAAERLLRKAGVDEIVGFDDNVMPYVDLDLGRLDAVLLDGPIALYYASPNPRLKLSGALEGPGEYALALRPDDAVLLAGLEQGLARVIGDGRLRQLLRKWRMWNGNQQGLARGARRHEELAAMKLDASGQDLAPAEPLPADAVNIGIIAASAQQWSLAEYAPLLLRAAGMTVLLTVASMAAAVLIGLLVVLARLYGPLPLRWAGLLYVEFFRGIPLLLLLFFLYFGLSSYGLELPALVTAVLGFGLTYGAYEAEVYRAALNAVPVGQWEAGRALGMSEPAIFRRIVLPQALRTALAPMTNDFVALFKDTSLVSVIAVRELTKEYLILSRSSLKFVELGLLTALLYLLMSAPLGWLSRAFERRFGAAG